jgi:hypothetical protein
MDSKITLSFDAQVIETARSYAESKNMSLSRLTEYLLRKVTDKNFDTLEALPIADWVKDLIVGEPVYIHKSKPTASKNFEYYESKFQNLSMNEPKIPLKQAKIKTVKKK